MSERTNKGILANGNPVKC